MRHAATLLALAIMLGSALSVSAQGEETGTAPAKTLEERIEDLETQLEVLRDSVNEPEGSIQATISEFKTAKKIKLSGYVQVRFEHDESSKEGTANKHTFDVRRARVKLAAQPTDNTLAVLQVDAAGSSVVAKDAYIAYTLGSGDPYANVTVTMGQYLLPFGFQVLQSSGVRETPETATVVRRLFSGDYDRGLKVSSPLDNRLIWEAGLFNGTGPNVRDNNHDKDLVGRVRYRVSPEFNIGASGYTGITTTVRDNVATETAKTRYGIDAQYYLHNTTFKAEYIAGEDLGHNKWGWYAQIAHNVSKWDTAVVMYDEFQDKTPAVQAPAASGKVSAINLGWIRTIDSATRLKLFYEINSEANKSVDNNVFRGELITNF